MTLRVFLDDLRYDYPWAWRTLVGFLSVFVLLIVINLLPQSPLLRMIGVSEVQDRVIAAESWVYWAARAGLNRKRPDLRGERRYALMEAMDQNGILSMELSEGDKFIPKQWRLANCRLRDPIGAKVVVSSMRNELAKIEIYGDQVVVWVGKQLLNLVLIEKGVAEPDPDPPTWIVDDLFARHYWAKMVGATPD